MQFSKHVYISFSEQSPNKLLFIAYKSISVLVVSPIFITLLGIDITESFSHPSNAKGSISITVSGSTIDIDAEKFLEEKLKLFGLNEKESCDFITYWLPVLLRNKLSLCSFQTQKYFENFEYEINPQPKSFLRVFLSIKKLKKEIKVEEQEIQEFKREGFTIVEWGGTEIEN